MNNTQLAAEIAALRERLNDLERNARRFAYLYVDHQHGNMRSNLGYHDIAEDDQLAFERWVFNADALSNDWVTPIPEAPTPEPDDAAKWEATDRSSKLDQVFRVLHPTPEDRIRDGTDRSPLVRTSAETVEAMLEKSFNLGLAIDPATLVVTDAMVQVAINRWYFDKPTQDAVRMRTAIEAAFAMVKGDSNGK